MQTLNGKSGGQSKGQSSYSDVQCKKIIAVAKEEKTMSAEEKLRVISKSLEEVRELEEVEKSKKVVKPKKPKEKRVMPCDDIRVPNKVVRISHVMEFEKGDEAIYYVGNLALDRECEELKWLDKLATQLADIPRVFTLFQRPARGKGYYNVFGDFIEYGKKVEHLTEYWVRRR